MKNTRLKVFSAAALLGAAACSVPVFADEVIKAPIPGVNNPLLAPVPMANASALAPPVLDTSEETTEFLRQKPVDTPTFHYLRENNVKLPQSAYERDDAGNIIIEKNNPIVIDGPPIGPPESAYTITNSNSEDYTFIHKTADENGNITDSYYKIDIKFPLTGNSEQSEDSHITWQEVDAPTEGETLPKDTIKVDLPNDVTKYYRYSYEQPANYTVAEEPINNTLNSSINDVVFKNFSFPKAISNTQDLSVDIVADFITNSSARGGAINNSGTIANITGNFGGNCAKSSSDYAYGGAIFNSGIISNIVGDFVGNSANSRYIARGGAIYNEGAYNAAIIDNITGNFIGNYAISSAVFEAQGGAIYNSSNYSIINNITGNFVGNYVFTTNPSKVAQGGAIYNFGSINNITGDFIGNSATSSGFAYGGAIHSLGKINNITGDFIGNYVSASKKVQGGAIYKLGDFNSIVGDFIGNYVISSSDEASGGAILNYTGSINNLTGDFIGNYAESSSATSYGGAIYNQGIITNITVDFIGNYAKSPSVTAYGGAIYNIKTINNITGDFIENYVESYGASNGGAIYNERTITNIAGNFINNSVVSTNDNANGGAISNTSNSGKATIGAMDGDGNVVSGIINSSFVNNYAKSETGEANGGAIYTNSDVNIIADNGVSKFSGNYTESAGVKDDNAIYLDSPDAKVNFKLKNNGSIYMFDNIRGKITTGTETLEDGTEVEKVDAYKVNISGDDTNTIFYMYNDMYNADLSVGNTSLNTINNSVHVYDVQKFTLNGDTKMAVDVDLENQEMDRITASEYGDHRDSTLTVTGMNLLSDAPEDRPVMEIYFAEKGLKDNVVNGISNGSGDLPQKEYQTSIYTPIFKYNVAYDTRDDAGYFVFAKGDRIITPGGGTTPSGNPSDAFNPAVLTSPVSSVAASQATINETFKYVFEHADAFTQLPQIERMSRINSNKYALGTSTDYNYNLGSLNYNVNNKAGWVRPYVTFEKMNLKNGPSVNATTYGTLVGFDTDFKEHKRGWYSVGTGYVGYNGSQLKYSGVDTSMNGGLIGYTHTRYKGNFWTALTISAGASVGESRTMYGKEDFTTLLAGVGSKTGYNFEFKEGKYILQPIMFMSYTFVNTFDYTNAAGVKIKPSPAHSIQLNPSVRFIANTKKGWQPYASVGMVWNVMNENKVSANSVRLPEMSMKPYVEYGLGVQRNWKDKFTAFGQAMIRNGGRNGIALSAGFRWALGHEGKPIEKVSDPTVMPFTASNSREPSDPLIIQDGRDGVTHNQKPTRTVIKQLTPAQRTALGARCQNTTRTTTSAILKLL